MNGGGVALPPLQRWDPILDTLPDFNLQDAYDSNLPGALLAQDLEKLPPLPPWPTGPSNKYRHDLGFETPSCSYEATERHSLAPVALAPLPAPTLGPQDFHFPPIGHANCTITLKSKGGPEHDVKPDPEAQPIFETGFQLPPLPPLEPPDPSWHFDFPSIGASAGTFLPELSYPQDESLIQGIDTSLEPVSGEEGFVDHSQLSTIFEETFPDLSDEMLSVPEISGDVPLPSMDLEDHVFDQGNLLDGSQTQQPDYFQDRFEHLDGGGALSPLKEATKKRRYLQHRGFTRVSDAQRARTRETARKLRQKKLETVQQLHQDVIDLTKENRLLVEDLKVSISVLDEITSQNKSLKSLLTCLHSDPSQHDSPRLQKLMKLKKDLEEKTVVPAPDSPQKTLNLEDVPLVSQSGKTEAGVDHFTVPCASICEVIDMHGSKPGAS